MTDFAVIADLPLGAYRARTPGGRLDPVPCPTRLHAALLCAAASGPRAEATTSGELRPTEQDLAALQWMEQHPPDGVRLPRTVEMPTQVYGYRREGTLVKEGNQPGPRDKVVQRPMVGLVAIDGPFAWTWQDPPPEDVRRCLVELCTDVAHLGNAETPVRMRVGEARPTHRWVPGADLFATPPGLDVDVARPGRSAALLKAYSDTRRSPTQAADRYTVTEGPRSAAFVGSAREAVRYVSLEPDDEPDAPWTTVLLAGFGQPHAAPLRGVEHVSWATTVHRALISLIGDGAPAILTGSYEPGAPQPANRVALHFLSPDAVATAGIDYRGSVLAALLPTEAGGAELAAVTEAFARLPDVRRGKTVRRLTALPPRSARRFWPTGSGNVFEVQPAAVPDTRPLGRDWTIADAVALSLGFVLRSRPELQGAGRGDARHRDTARLVREAGLHVHAVKRVMDGDLSRYAHRIHEGRVVQPYRATLSLGGLLDDRSLVALGQSRHLGGGLLAPLGTAE